MRLSVLRILGDDRGRISVPANAALLVVLTGFLFALPGVSPLAYLVVLAISLAATAVFLMMLFDDEIELSGTRFAVSGALILACVTLGFASVYYAESRFEATAFNPSLSRSRAVYFSIGNMSTVGSNDGEPASETARASVAAQQTADFILVAFLIGGILRRLGRPSNDTTPTSIREKGNDELST